MDCILDVHSVANWGAVMKFIELMEIPVKISYIYEEPEPDVGFVGGIHIESAVPVLDHDSLEEICLAHWETAQEKKQALYEDYCDALRETEMLVEQWNAEKDRNAYWKRKVKHAT